MLKAKRKEQSDSSVVDFEVTKLQSTKERMEKLGFKTVASKMDIATKMALAYSKYLFVSQDAIVLFNQKLREETTREDIKFNYYKKLTFIKLEDYPKVPPDHVLNALERAQADKLFDLYEIAKIKDVVERKDPILFGKINGCSDYFFIAQWDDDVRFEEILSLNVKTK